MITKMVFEKLFGRFDYEITFKAEGVTIITGSNGYGKSTILKCIDNLSEGNLYHFANLNFKRLEIFFNEPEKYTVMEKTDKELSINGIKFPLEMFLLRSNDKMVNSPFSTWEDFGKWNKRTLKEELFQYEYITQDNYIRSYAMDNQEKKLIEKYSKICENIKTAVGKIYFIKEQRLIKQKKSSKEGQEIINVIEDLPNKFKNLISDISTNYSTIANKLDSTYPNRLFNMEVGINEDEYHIKMEEMNNKFEKLIKYDISSMQITTDVIFKQEHAKALKVYFDDFNEKYKVYEDFIKRLDLFTDIVNSRLSFKEIKISRELGIIVVDKDNLKSKLNLNKLSSGEKQEIVLFYDLIFETKNEEFLLIDEPEISLHITWQKMFMDDLLKIVDYKKLKVIVATHSPQIINNHWDRQIDLGDLYGNQLNKG